MPPPEDKDLSVEDDAGREQDMAIDFFTTTPLGFFIDEHKDTPLFIEPAKPDAEWKPEDGRLTKSENGTLQVCIGKNRLLLIDSRFQTGFRLRKESLATFQRVTRADELKRAEQHQRPENKYGHQVQDVRDKTKEKTDEVIAQLKPLITKLGEILGQRDKVYIEGNRGIIIRCNSEADIAECRGLAVQLGLMPWKFRPPPQNGKIQKLVEGVEGPRVEKMLNAMLADKGHYSLLQTLTQSDNQRTGPYALLFDINTKGLIILNKMAAAKWHP